MRKISNGEYYTTVYSLIESSRLDMSENELRLEILECIKHGWTIQETVDHLKLLIKESNEPETEDTSSYTRFDMEP